MKAYIYPGQGAQFAGMGNALYEAGDLAQSYFAKANEIIGFDLCDIMRNGSEEDLRQTSVTQPAIFLHSIITGALRMQDTSDATAVAGHSLGEFSALVASGVLNWTDAFSLVSQRANAMQMACDMNPGTMAAIMCNDFAIVEITCQEVQSTSGEIVVPANYNSPGQLVISGSHEGVRLVSEAMTAKGAKAIPLSVGGAFHSPLMQPAQDKLSTAIENTVFHQPNCPIYQNVDAQPNSDIFSIKDKLSLQLTAPVRWQQTIENMFANNITSFVEVGGRGSILLGMVRKINRAAQMANL